MGSLLRVQPGSAAGVATVPVVLTGKTVTPVCVNVVGPSTQRYSTLKPVRVTPRWSPALKETWAELQRPVRGAGALR